MKKVIMILIGIAIAYLIMVGEHNTWDFLTGLEPTECAKRIASFIFFTCLWTFALWLIVIGLFGWDE